MEVSTSSLGDRTAVVGAHCGFRIGARALILREPDVRATVRRVLVCGNGTFKLQVAGPPPVTLG